MTPQERSEKISLYESGFQRFHAALDEVPQAARQWRPAPGKWSVHEVVIHCADSEMNAALRIRYLLAEPSPTIIGYDQDRWAVMFDYHSRPLGPALAAIESARAHTASLIRSVPADWWLRSGTHTERGPYSAETWLETYADHLEIHRRQIERTLAAWQEQASKS